MLAERNMKWAQGLFPGKELAVCRTLGQLGPWSSLLGTLPFHSYYSQSMELTSQEPDPGTAFSKENELYLSHGLLVLGVSRGLQLTKMEGKAAVSTPEGKQSAWFLESSCLYLDK